MGKMPLKYVVDALNEIKSGRKWFIQTGKGKCVSFTYYENARYLNVEHYGKEILLLDMKKRTCEVGGWSATDRDIINSVFVYYRLPMRVSVAGGQMHFAETGKKACKF